MKIKLTATNQEAEPFRLERLNQFYLTFKKLAKPIVNIDYFIESIHDHKGCVIIKWYYKAPQSVIISAGVAWESVGESKRQVEHEYPYDFC